MLKIIPDDEHAAYFHPKVTAHDESTIAVGLKIYLRNKVPMIPEFVPILNHAGQQIQYTIDLGTSIEKVMSSEEPLLKSLSSGFRVEAKASLISNMKRVFMELSKHEEYMEQIGPAMMAAPVFMIAVNGKVNVKFNDFEEIESHPMAGPLMATFEQLFEGMLQRSPHEFMDDRFDAEGIEAEPNSKDGFLLQGIELHHLILEALNDMPRASHINYNVSVPEMLLNVEADINAPGLKDALLLAMHLPIHKI